MVWDGSEATDILTEASFENAITADMAIGGSTNAIIHLVALAGRAGYQLDLKKFDDISSRTPMIANLRLFGRVSDGRFLLRWRVACVAQTA